MKFLPLLLLSLFMGCSQIPGYLEHEFEGSWSTPGLVDSEGNRYKLPAPNKKTGKTIKVTDFGATADKENFDNTESFQKAIETAMAGDEVYIPDGSYYFSSPALFSSSAVAHISLKTGVNLRGAGRDKTILISNFDSRSNEKYKTAVIVASAQSDIVISDLTVTSNTDDSRLPDPDASNVNNFVETAPVYGIVIDNSKPVEIHGNVYIHDVLVEKFRRMGIRIRVVHDVKVEDSIIQKAMDLGGGGAGYGISIQGMGNGAEITDSNLDTVHNVVENCQLIGPYLRHGILLQYSAHNNLISGNIVSDTLLDAIDLHGEDEYSNEISNNTITNTRRGAAIGVGNSGATHDAAGPYNYIHNNTIEGGDRGIDVLYGSPNTIITENSIKNLIKEDDATGIFLQNAPDTIIRDNKISHITGDESVGIKVLYSYNALEPAKGIPDGIQIIDNELTGLNSGIYIEAHSENFHEEGNKFNDIAGDEYTDGTEKFEVPPISDVVIPKYGDILLPTDDNFITNENRRYPQTQPNMKFKTSTFDVPYNRMVYMKFDLTEAPSKWENVYLKLSAKSKDGLATINIHGSTEYTNWKEDSITWENSRFHKDQVAVILDENKELTTVTDFTFTTVGTEFNTYYIDVTGYIKSINPRLVTLILSNDAIENMYCEIYSKEVSAENYRPALLFVK